LIIPFFGCEKTKKPDQKKYAETFLKVVEQTPVDANGYLQLVDSLYKISKQIDYKKGITKSISLKGNYFYSKGRFDEALGKYSEAVKVSEQLNDQYALGDAYYNIGSTYFDLKKREEAIVALKRSIVIRTASNDSVGLGSSLNFTGYVYWLISNYDSAVYYFEKALVIRNKLPNKMHRATTYNNLGTVFYNWSLYDKALDHYLRSLELQKEEKNNNGVARCLCNIGLVFNETAQNEKAIEYYRESLPYANASKLVQTIGYVYNCLGTAFSPVNKDSALFYLKKSLDIYQAGNDTIGTALAYQGLGNFYLDIKDWKNAKIYFTQMLKIAISENIPMRIARAYKGLGQTFLLGNNLVEAQENFEKSVVIGEKSSIKFILRDAFANLAEIYERQGKTDKALAAMKQYNEYNLQIENEGMQKRLLDLKNKSEYDKYRRSLDVQKYENEKQKIYLAVTISAILFLLIIAIILFRMNNKRKKINLLLQEKNLLIEGQSKEIKLKNVELLELNEAKEKLFSIIAHDLRSPFNTLINIAIMLKEDYHEFSDDERLEYITAFEETAIKTFELVENLLNLSASRTGRISFNPVIVETAKIADKIINLCIPQANKKEIKLLNTIDKNSTAFVDPSMLEIIIRNLMNNAIKYCKTGGRVELSAYKEDQKLFIAVHDNGIGMDDATQENIFNINVIHSKMGTGGERGTGLGLGLCKEFVEKNGGRIWVESELDKGSKFVFSVPSEQPEL
jgi:signal transduction histidine kinase